MAAASSKVTHPGDSPAERRGYFRVNDAVALKINQLEPAALDGARDRIEQRERELQAHRASDGAQLKVALREVENKHPEVANLFRLFDARLEALSEALSPQQKSESTAPNVVASLSGSGLAFDWANAYFEGDRLMMQLTLFPLRYQIELVAEVVRGKPTDRATDGRFHCAVRFEHIAATDREVLLQHIHRLQLESLRSRNDD